MTETLAAPVKPAVADATKGATGTNGGQEPTTAADAFAAALLALAPTAGTTPAGTTAASARTALAEGSTSGGDSSGSETGKAAPDDQSSATEGLTALLALGTLPVQVTGQAVAVPAQAAPATGSGSTGSVKAVTALGGPAQPAAAIPAAAAPAPLVPDTGNPVGPAADTAAKAATPARVDKHPATLVAAPHDRPHTAPPVAPAGNAGGQASQGGTTAQQGDTSGKQAGERPKPEVAQAPPVQGASSTQSTTQGAPVAQTQKPAAVEAPAAPEKPVHLRELPEAVQTAVRVAAREGRTTASVELHPAELGRVEIRLHYDANGGVSARVTADSPTAASALQAQAPDLRRSLEAQGLTVLGLDVGQAGVGSETSPDRDRMGTFAQQAASGSSSHDDELETAQTTTIDVSSLPLAAGQLDVLA